VVDNDDPGFHASQTSDPFVPYEDPRFFQNDYRYHRAGDGSIAPIRPSGSG
jgi:hypothetical protein